MRLRLFRRDDKIILLRTLKDWTHCKYGINYKAEWDGKDASEHILDNKKVFVLFEAKYNGNLKTHQGHPEEICRDPIIKIISPKAEDTVSGKEKIVAILPKYNIDLSSGTNFVGRLYVDYKLFHKISFNKAQQEFEFTLDTNSIEDGVHILTVNVDDGLDHIGTASVITKVKNNKSL